MTSTELVRDTPRWMAPHLPSVDVSTECTSAHLDVAGAKPHAEQAIATLTSEGVSAEKFLERLEQ